MDSFLNRTLNSWGAWDVFPDMSCLEFAITKQPSERH